MPRPPKDFSIKVIDSEFIDVTELAKKYDVDDVALEQYMREYHYFADKRRADNRTKRKRYEKIEEHLAAAQNLLEASDIGYDDEAMAALIVHVQHTQDMLVAKGIDRKQCNRILVSQLSELHPKPTVNTWEGYGHGDFFNFCQDVFNRLDVNLTDSAIIHLIERHTKK